MAFKKNELASCDTAPKGVVARMRGNSIKRVLTRMDTIKSGWTPNVYYTTLYSIPCYTTFTWVYWAHF